MKHSVVIEELSEQEIRPLELFDEYLEMMSTEAAAAFADTDLLVDVPCPACDEPDSELGFRKGGFAYHVCGRCESLYASPRPTSAALDEFRATSKALAFWTDRSLPETAEARRGVSEQRARWLAALADEYLPNAATVADVAPGAGAFLAEVERLGRFERTSGVEWRPDLDAGDHAADAIAAFDFLQQLHDPGALLRWAREVLPPGGLVLLTTSTISGFDLRVLWDRSRNIYFPQQINILSIEGIELLVTELGFEILELSTPGQLDVSSVAAAIDEGAPVDRFVSYMLARRSERSHRQFQELLQQHLLSSHVRLALRKPL